MKVLVTGGAGFIGANLCNSLAAESTIDQVVALDDLSTGRKENLAAIADVELVEGSILDRALLDALFNGVDAVVHLAARPSVPRSLADPMATHAVNVDGTMEVLEAARRHGRPQLIVASSSSVYGANPALPKREDMATLPVSPYAASKLAAESASLAYGHSFDLPVLAFRFFNVFGPLQPADHAYAAVVPTFVAAALRNEPLPVHGDGRQTRDFTFVGSVVAVLTEALVARISDPQPVNLAFGTRVSLLELIDQLEGVVGHPLERRHTERRPGDVRDSQADQSRLRGLFPDVEPVPLDEGLRATVEWFEVHAVR
ncbi:MAG: NAD-dependent epimerase/dehydratase family protein [Acidimicrobiales bacterium]